MIATSPAHPPSQARPRRHVESWCRPADHSCPYHCEPPQSCRNQPRDGTKSLIHGFRLRIGAQVVGVDFPTAVGPVWSARFGARPLWSGQCPCPVGAGQTAVDEGSEIDCGATDSPPGVVLFHAQVAQLDPPSWAGGGPADDSLDGRAGGVGCLNSGVRACARAARNNASCSWMLIDRPSLAVVHRARSGQSAHTAPKVTVRFGLMVRVCPPGQVTVPACSSMAKSSRVNPPGTAGSSGLALITVSCPPSA